jgi:hypothetical protein
MTKGNLHGCLLGLMVVSFFFDATLLSLLLIAGAYFTSAHFESLIKDK